MQTRLNRLVAKRVVTRSDGRPARYVAAVGAEAVGTRHLDLLVERIRGFKIVPLVAHLVRDRRLTAEELRELKQLIDQAEALNGTRRRRTKSCASAPSNSSSPAAHHLDARIRGRCCSSPAGPAPTRVARRVADCVRAGVASGRRGCAALGSGALGRATDIERCAIHAVRGAISRAALWLIRRP